MSQGLAELPQANTDGERAVKERDRLRFDVELVGHGLPQSAESRGKTKEIQTEAKKARRP